MGTGVRNFTRMTCADQVAGRQQMGCTLGNFTRAHHGVRQTIVRGRQSLMERLSEFRRWV